MLSLLKTTEQADLAQVSFVAAGIIGCVIWLIYLGWTQWILKCCGKTPQKCRCHEERIAKQFAAHERTKCGVCGLYFGMHDKDCTES